MIFTLLKMYRRRQWQHILFSRWFTAILSS